MKRYASNAPETSANADVMRSRRAASVRNSPAKASARRMTTVNVGVAVSSRRMALAGVMNMPTIASSAPASAEVINASAARRVVETLHCNVSTSARASMEMWSAPAVSESPPAKKAAKNRMAIVHSEAR